MNNQETLSRKDLIERFSLAGSGNHLKGARKLRAKFSDLFGMIHVSKSEKQVLSFIQTLGLASEEEDAKQVMSALTQNLVPYAPHYGTMEDNIQSRCFKLEKINSSKSYKFILDSDLRRYCLVHQIDKNIIKF